jgi:hypothetical protein
MDAGESALLNQAVCLQLLPDCWEDFIGWIYNFSLVGV